MGIYPGPGAGILLPFWEDELERITHEVRFVHHQSSTGTRLHPCYCPTEAELEALRDRDIWIRRADTCFEERWYLTREQAAYVTERVGRGEPVIIYHGRTHDCVRLIRDPGRYTLRSPVRSTGPFAYLVKHSLPVPAGMPIPAEDGPYGTLVSWYRYLTARRSYPLQGSEGVLCSSCRLRILNRGESRGPSPSAGRLPHPAGRAPSVQLPLFARSGDPFPGEERGAR